LRSAKVVYKAIPRLANTMIAMSINFSMSKIQSIVSSVIYSKSFKSSSTAIFNGGTYSVIALKTVL
jgi:tetrahydromethanopterin S-methyltransferase subunit F